MNTTEWAGTSALVTGASRGLGRAIAVALHRTGADVVAVGRDDGRLTELRRELGDRITTVSADVTDPVVAGRLIEQHRPRVLVLNAGAQPLMRPLHYQSWESFSRVWDTDVQHAFHWTREALLLPLDPGSTVVAMSSGAALFGSPLSGGYAGAKAMIRFLTGYAAGESDRAGLGIRFLSVLPSLTPQTDLGAMAVAAYARREGVGVAEQIGRMGDTLRPEDLGKRLVDLVATGTGSGAYLATPDGLKEITP